MARVTIQAIARTTTPLNAASKRIGGQLMATDERNGMLLHPDMIKPLSF
jgi:hypothetical protein